MGKRTRRNHAPAELARQFDARVNQITQWKGQLPEGAAGFFTHVGSEPSARPVDVKLLRARTGELALENDFLEGPLAKAGLPGAKPDDCSAIAPG